jgi:prepilin signal peptidase PulO-like enzyme (type II secretory pathway)
VVIALLVLAVESALPSAQLYEGLYYFPEPVILSGIIGGGIGFIFFLVVYLIYPRGMGPGDVKLAALIGLVVGFPMVLVALFIGIFAGGVFAIALLLFRLRGRKAEIPYGTFLATGPVITMLWGNEILAWYLGFF